MPATTPLSVHAPRGDRKGGVVVFQEAFGVNEHIEDICRRLADAGWLAVAPHLFHRSGDPKLGYDDMSQVMPHMSALNPHDIGEDIDAAFEHLAEEGVALGNSGVVGFCMGGTLALWTATQRDIGAAVTFYGGGVTKGRFGLPSLVDLGASLRAPWLGLYGDRDTGIPVEDVEELRASTAASAQPTELVRYPDAEHGFNCDIRRSYHAASAVDAWKRMLDWFDRYVAQPG